MEKSHTYRDGDRMVTVTVDLQSAVVQFAEILEAVKIEDDNDYDPFDGDTWAHEFVDIPSDVDVDWEKVQAAIFTGTPSRDTGSRWRLIKLHWDPLTECGAPGMSKQVRYEYGAGVKARLLTTIRKILACDFTGYGVVGDFRGFGASVWGVDDEEYAETYVRDEIAGEIAYDMVKAGYTVVGYPPVKTHEEKHEELKKKIRRNMGEEE